MQISFPHIYRRAECLRCQFAVRARTGQCAGVAPLRSALHSNRTFVTRGRYFVDRCPGVLFPAAFIQNAGYKVFLRAQSERSERLRELTPAARRRGRYFVDRQTERSYTINNDRGLLSFLMSAE